MTHKKAAESQSTYKGYIIPPPPLLPIPHSFSARLQHKTATTEKEMWVPFLNLTLFCIIKKKGKGFAMVHSASLYGSLVVWGTHVTLRHRERARVRVVTQPPTLLHSTVEERPGKASNPAQLLLLHTKLILRCARSSWETNIHHNKKKEAMLSESWDKKDRAYLCGCMAAWHTVMSTLIKHGGHSQPSVGEGSALQARRSGPSDVSQILTGRFPCRRDTRPPLIGWNVSWVIIFVQCRQGQHCECQRQGKKNKHRARPKTTK